MYKKWAKYFGFHASFTSSPRFPAQGFQKRKEDDRHVGLWVD
jgi:hypothetical protein